MLVFSIIFTYDIVFKYIITCIGIGKHPWLFVLGKKFGHDFFKKKIKKKKRFFRPTDPNIFRHVKIFFCRKHNMQIFLFYNTGIYVLNVTLMESLYPLTTVPPVHDTFCNLSLEMRLLPLFGIVINCSVAWGRLNH